MTSAAASPDGSTDRRPLPGAAAQTFAVVGGLAAWGVALLVAYPMVQIACAAGRPELVHLVRWTAIAVAVAATAVGRSVHRRAGIAERDDRAGDRARRARFVGFVGAVLSASGVLLLVVEDLATWVIDPCL